MTSSARAPLGGVLALALATAMGFSAVSAYAVSGLIAIIIVLLAMGWPILLDLPSKKGSSLIIALSGFTALAMAYARFASGEVSRLLILTIAAAVFFSFAHEMFRRSRRLLTLSISGTASGALLSIMSVTWLQSLSLVSGVGAGALMLLISITLATAAGLISLALPATGKVRIPLSIISAAAVGGGVSWALGFTVPAVVLATIAGAILATGALSMHFLLERVIGSQDPLPSLALATAPLATVGILAVMFVHVAVSYIPQALGLRVIPTALGAI